MIEYNPSLWGVVSAAFDSSLYHPDVLKFAIGFATLFDGINGRQTALVLPNTADGVLDLGNVVKHSPDTFIATTMGPSFRPGGCLEPTARVKTLIVDNLPAHQQTYATVYLLPTIKMLLRGQRLSAAAECPLNNYHALLHARNFFGNGVTNEFKLTLLLRFIRDMGERFNSQYLKDEFTALNGTNLYGTLIQSLDSIFLLVQQKKWYKMVGKQLQLTAGATAMMDQLEKLLHLKLDLAYYYAANSFTAAGRIRLTRGAPLPETFRGPKIERYSDIVDCVNSYPFLVPLLGWADKIEGAATLEGALTDGELKRVHYATFDYLRDDALALIQPHAARTTSSSWPVRQLTLVAAIMAGTDVTSSIKFVGRPPTFIRQAFRKEAMVEAVDAKGLASNEILELFGCADAGELVFGRLVNPTYTDANASHTIYHRAQGLKYYSSDNRTFANSNIKEWVLHHGAYITEWSALAEKGLLPAVFERDEEGKVHSPFKDILPAFAASDAPTCARDVARVFVAAHTYREEPSSAPATAPALGVPELDFVGAWPCVADFTWLLKRGDIPAFEKTGFYTIDLPFEDPCSFVVRVKGLGEDGIVANLIAYHPYGINDLKRSKHAD